MPPTPPFWLLQRQVKVEPVSDESLRLTAPNLPPFELGVKAGANGWLGVLYRLSTGEGDKVLLAETDPGMPGPQHAWEAAFELYRQHVIV